MIGMAAVMDGYPLYFDATNEKGLCIAGLNFPGNACYHPYNENMKNVASFELIPWLLCSCATLDQARAALKSVNIWEQHFSEAVQASPLHWLIADQSGSIVLESTKDGLHIYENQFGILTNNPPFPYHEAHVAQYMRLTNEQPMNSIAKDLDLFPISLGLGAMGLPGDPSSPSRFLRATFTKCNTPASHKDAEAITNYFHILGAVEQPKGVNRMPDGSYEYTVYSSCCHVNKGIYFYKTYDGPIRFVDMYSGNLDGNALLQYPLE